MEKISILMGIYNCATTLPEAIDSILAQTYTNWELIMCDDGSKDDTFAVATTYAMRYPEKIRLLKNEENKGLNYTLNKCLKNATGFYIARMDGDDISLPTRFEKMVKAIASENNISIVSCPMVLFDETGDWGLTKVNLRPMPNDLVKKTPFCHAACLVKKEAYDAVGGYSEGQKLLRVEDYHLWVKMYVQGYRGINLEEPLYKMRDDRNAQSRRKLKYRFNEAYVKAFAIKNLKLPFYKYAYCLKPIILGLCPGFIYKILHRKKQDK